MKYNKIENKLKFDYNNMMASYIGENGFTEKDLAEMNASAKAAFNFVSENRGKGWMGWTELPYNQKEIVEDILKTAKDVRKNFDNFVVLGIGGSALGPIAVYQALCHLHHNELPKKVRKSPKFYVEDNVDPERMNALFDIIDPAKTMFNVITKSGATSETMSQYLIVTDILKEKLGENYKNKYHCNHVRKLGQSYQNRKSGRIQNLLYSRRRRRKIFGTLSRRSASRGGARHRYQGLAFGRGIYG